MIPAAATSAASSSQLRQKSQASPIGTTLNYTHDIYEDKPAVNIISFGILALEEF